MRRAHLNKDQHPLSIVARIESAVVLISVIAAGVLVLPASNDVFRFPKDLWVRAETIALLACWLLLAIWSMRPRISKDDRNVLLLAAAAVAWTWIATAFSTKRVLSTSSALWASSVAVILITAYMLARERKRTSDLAFLLIPGCLNALLAISQASEFWNPFTFAPGTPLPQRITALVGNPNELGTYLVLPFLVSLALMIALPQRRWLFGILSFICLSGIFASRTRTAMIAAAAGVFCIIWVAAKRRVLAVTLIAAGCAGILVVLIAGGFITRGDLNRFRTIDGLNVALSSRVTPTLAALEMFRDHPLTGVGPGAFAYWYFDYKIAVEREHPPLFHNGDGFLNFGEAHDDHAQILSEAGLPGYLIFLATLIFVGWHSFRDAPDSEAARAARLIAFPVAAALFVLCLAQFPLRIASATISYGFVLTNALGWLRK